MGHIARWLGRALFIGGLTLTSAWSEGLYNPKSFTLDNGLKVVVLENHRAPIVAQFLWFKVGSCDDPLGKSGIAHFLEHLRFKGPSGSASSEIMRQVEAVGGSQNASTSYDFTNFYQVVAKQHLERIMKLESERLGRLQTLPEQAATELKVVQEERRMRTDNEPTGRFVEAFNSLFYRTCPYRIPVIGWPEEIARLTLEDARAFYEYWYAPSNAILFLAGDVTLEEAKALVNKYYAPLPKRPVPVRTRLGETFPLAGQTRFTYPAKDIQVPLLVRAYPAPNYLDDKGAHRYTAQLIENMLGATPTGYVYQQLVEKQKVASGLHVDYTAFMRGPSSFNVILQPTQNTSLETLEKALDECLRSFAKEGLTEEALAKAKSRMLASIEIERDSPLAGVDNLAQGLVMDIPLEELDQWDKKIEAVTLKDVKALYARILAGETHLTGLLVPPHKDASATKKEEKGARP